MELHILILIFFTSKACSEILSLKHNRSQFDLLGKILEEFFLDQESVTIFNVDKSLYLREHESAVAEVIQKIAPVMIYDELWNELASRITDMGDELNVPSTTKSYFLTTASVSLTIKHLPLFAEINANGKWIFTTVELKQSEVESILATAWNQYKMANILALTFIDDKMSVVSFNPFETQNEKHGKFWYSEVNSESLLKILKKVSNIFDMKVKNLQTYFLKATKFLDISEHNKLLDAEMMKVFEKTLNTKFTFAVSRDGDYHGTRLSNGTFTGSIREVEEGLTDIAMNNRLFSPMDSTNCAFLNPAGATDMKYIMRKSPSALTLLNFHLVQAFDWPSRFLYLLISLTFIAVFIVSKMLDRKHGKNLPYDEVFMVVLMTLGVQCSISMPSKKIASIHQKILIMSLLVFSLIKCNAFQGTIVSNLSRPMKSTGEINTLEQLLKSDLNLTALTILPDLFKPNENETNVNGIQKRLYQRQTLDNFLSVEKADEVLMGQPKQAILSKF